MQLITKFFKVMLILGVISFLVGIHSNFTEMLVFLSICLYLVFFLYFNRSFVPLMYCIFIFLSILFPWICVQLEVGLEIMTWYSSEVSLHTMIYINIFIIKFDTLCNFINRSSFAYICFSVFVKFWLKSIILNNLR